MTCLVVWIGGHVGKIGCGVLFYQKGRNNSTPIMHWARSDCPLVGIQNAEIRSVVFTKALGLSKVRLLTNK